MTQHNNQSYETVEEAQAAVDRINNENAFDPALPFGEADWWGCHVHQHSTKEFLVAREFWWEHDPSNCADAHVERQFLKQNGAWGRFAADGRHDHSA